MDRRALTDASSRAHSRGSRLANVEAVLVQMALPSRFGVRRSMTSGPLLPT
jgi:hypothetical protein